MSQYRSVKEWSNKFLDQLYEIEFKSRLEGRLVMAVMSAVSFAEEQAADFYPFSDLRPPQVKSLWKQGRILEALLDFPEWMEYVSKGKNAIGIGGQIKGIGGVSVRELATVAKAYTEKRRQAIDASFDASRREPTPVANDSQLIYELVIADIVQRAKTGQDKYGMYLQAGNGRDALVDAYQEAIDLAMYLRQAIEERNGTDEANI